MRPIDSSYDRTIAREESEAQKLLVRMQAGEVVSYEGCEKLGDAGWDSIRDEIEEVPGEGWTAKADPRAAILAEARHDRVATLDAIRERYNCRRADVDASGDVWIEGPQSGHWLDEDALAELVEWGRANHGWA